MGGIASFSAKQPDDYMRLPGAAGGVRLHLLFACITSNPPLAQEFMAAKKLTSPDIVQPAKPQHDFGIGFLHNQNT